MTTASVPTRWPLARVLILILAAAFLGLMNDIRVEHIDIVRETWKGWIPIVYSFFMALACIIAACCWNKITRVSMLILFLAAFVVGGLGFWFHNDGHLVKVAEDSARAWTDLKMKRLNPKDPPETAPLAFAGLGVLGTLACCKRFNP